MHISPSTAIVSSAARVNESRRQPFAMDKQFNLFLHIECSYNSLVCSSDGFYRRILHVLSTYFANLFVIPVSLVCKLSNICSNFDIQYFMNYTVEPVHFCWIASAIYDIYVG